MNKYKPKDIIVVVVAGIIFVVALAFMIDSMSGTKSSKTEPQPKDLINEPDFNDKYDEAALKEIDTLKDFGLINVNGLCKGSLFSVEDSLPEGSVCYALQKLGLTETSTNNENGNNAEANTEEVSRNSERDKIIKSTKDALESYYAKNKDYPQSASDKKLSSLYGTGAPLSAFVVTGTKTDDPSGENTRMCYSRRSATQYWLYYIAEPTDAPIECKSEDPKDIEGSVDFSVR